jgi:hypothetical protein
MHGIGRPRTNDIIVKRLMNQLRERTRVHRAWKDKV